MNQPTSKKMEKFARVTERKMKEDLFTNLPPEIIIDILSRLPVRTIMSCKCVCKSWRNLMESLEFANSHLAKSVSGLVSQQLFGGEVCKVSEFIDEVNPCCNKSFSFEFSHPVVIGSSVDGLLFFRQLGDLMRLYICNPITRKYIKLPYPPNYLSYSHNWGIVGFGVSRITHQYKILCIGDDVYIYTLGTGCWRTVPGDRLQFCRSTETNAGVFLNGNLHWLSSDDLNGTTPRIYCLDLETELFSTFSLHRHSHQYLYANKSLTALGGRLCFLGGDLFGGEIVMWLMKVYGDDKSWTREFVIKEQFPWNLSHIEVVKVLKDGEVLFATRHGGKLVCFSTKNNTIRTINLPGLHADSFTITVAYTPSFLPQLKSFVKENVGSF